MKFVDEYITGKEIERKREGGGEKERNMFVEVEKKGNGHSDANTSLRGRLIDNFTIPLCFEGGLREGGGGGGGGGLRTTKRKGVSRERERMR